MTARGSDERARREAERDEVRRFTRRARRRTGVLVGLGAALAALLAFVVIAVATPVMSVRQITIEGLQRLDRAAVEQALADLTGTPLALVTQDDLAQRLAGFVLVQSYTSRAAPPSTLVVEISERPAIGALATPTGAAVVDPIGVTLWDEPGPPADVPMLALPDASFEGESFRSAAAVSRSLPTSFREQVATIEAITTDDVRLHLRGGGLVVWGSADDSARKVDVLLLLLQATAGRPVSEFDVSSPETPVTR